MGLDKNNNSRIIYRIARSNLLSRKLSSFFSALSVFLAVVLTTVISLYVTGYQHAERRILDQMQQVLYMNVTEAQAADMASDDRMEAFVLYKYCGEKFQTDGREYRLVFFGRDDEPEIIKTYEITEGRTPKEYHEIAVDKAFLAAMHQEAVLGTKIRLQLGTASEEFEVCAFTDSQSAGVSHIYTSLEFARNHPVMKNVPLEALVRVRDAKHMAASEFSAMAYQIAADYGVRRQDVNVNGRFELSLQGGNAGILTIIFVSALLFLAGGIVISSVFYFSVVSRVRQIGQFQTIGMTEKQVKKMIRREGLLLCAVSIPCALAAGGVLAYVLLPDGWSLLHYAVTCLAAGTAGCVIVQLAVQKPALIAAGFSPVEAAKSTGSDESQRTFHRKRRRLSPYVLARAEQRRSTRRWKLVTASLALGGILFMTAASWNASWDKEAFSRQGYFQDAEFYISYQYSHDSPKTYGITDMQLEGHLNAELKEALRQIPQVRDVKEERTATGVIEYQGSTFNQPFYPLAKEDAEYLEIEAEGNLSYDYMAQNDAILIIDREFEEKINGVSFRPGECITLRYFDGTEHETQLEIAAVTDATVHEETDRPNYIMADVTMEKLWKTMNTAQSFTVSVEDYEADGMQAEQKIRSLLGEYSDLSLLTLREQLLEDAGLIQEYQLQIYGISILVILFGMFNLANTVISSFVSRKRELSMLESVGMQQRQIRSMLLWESIFLALPNLVITFTAGTLAGYGFIWYMKQSARYLRYEFPLLAAVFYTAAMLVIPAVLASLCLREQNRTALIERIKAD